MTLQPSLAVMCTSVPGAQLDWKILESTGSPGFIVCCVFLMTVRIWQSMTSLLDKDLLKMPFA